MFRSLLLLIVVSIGSTTFGQISLSTSVLNFPETMYGDSSVLNLKITSESDAGQVVSLKSHHPDFRVDGQISIKAKEESNVRVVFKPRHNINYNTELVVLVPDGNQGAFSVDVRGKGRYSGYYSSTFDLYEEDLKDALKSTISAGYKNLGYTGARDAMYGSIDNVNGKVTCVYTGRTATFNSRSGANNNSFNCEHTWPQSLFNQREPERADIHHLFPTDAAANGKRSNYPFGEVTSASWTEGGSKLGGGVFEPRDEHKGDVARAMFYFAIRYQNYSSFLTSQEAVLRKWDTLHPPTKWSMDRNIAIFNRQGNRNPFVDHPEFLERITSVSQNSVAQKYYAARPSEQMIFSSVVEEADGYRLVLTNTGNQKLEFDTVGSDNADFQVNISNFDLEPGESQTVLITYDHPSSNTTIISFKSEQVKVEVPMEVGIGSVDGVQQLSNVIIANNGHRVSIKNAMGTSFQLINSSGQVVAFTEIQSDFTEISLPHLLSGIYFAYIESVSASGIVRKILIP